MPNYGFGSAANSITEFDDMTPRLPDPYPVEHEQYASIPGQNGRGQPIYFGPFQITWHWERLSLAQFNQLYQAWLASRTCYIRSRVYGGSEISFEVFQVTMWAPTASMTPGPWYRDVVVKFSVLLPPTGADPVVSLPSANLSSLSNNDPVASWPGTGTTPDADQSTSGYRPLYKTASTPNGAASVYFDGSDDYLDLGDISALFAKGAASLFVVAAPDDDAAWSLYETNSGLAGQWRKASDGSGDMAAFRGALDSGYPTGPLSSANWHCYTLISSGSTYELFIDGVSQGAGSLSWSAGDRHIIGAGFNGAGAVDTAKCFKGWIAGVFVFDEAKTPLQQALLESQYRSAYITGGYNLSEAATDQGTAPILQLDAASLGLIDDQPISSWLDSVTLREANQSTSSRRPLYKESAITGFPALYFDGADDYLDLGNLGVALLSGESSLFVIAAPDDDISGYSIFGAYTPLIDDWWSNPLLAYGNLNTFRNSEITGYPASTPTSGWHKFSLISGPTNYEEFIDSVSSGVKSQAWDPGTHHVIGSGFDISGNINST